MADNKFVFFLLEHEPAEFPNIFAKLPEEDREAFLDCILDLLLFVMNQVRHEPIEIKSMVLLSGIERLTKEQAQKFAALVQQME